MKNDIFFDVSQSLLSERVDLARVDRSVELLRRPASFSRPIGVWLRDGGGDCRRASARSRLVIPFILLILRIPSRAVGVARVEEMASEKVRRRPTVCGRRVGASGSSHSTCGEKECDPEKVRMVSSISKSTPCRKLMNVESRAMWEKSERILRVLDAVMSAYDA